MRIVIEQSDFRRLSTETQKELMEAFAGKALVVAPPAKKQGKALWRQPMDLSPDLVVRLLHGISEPHRVRLRLFAQKGGRVTQRELLRATGDEDLRVLSHFQAVLSRRLRRLLDDPEKRIHLIGWDFGATKWDKSHTNIINGVYYVTEPTTRALQGYFEIKPKKGATAR
ncbi:MAG: hypothetical protein ACTSQ7_08525 [Alphaproteobacteria bacterium]